MNFQSKVIVVTGANSGIGLSLVRQLLENNAKVVGIDITVDALESVSDESLSYYTCDISSRTEVEAVVQNILEKLEKIDGLINCAGIIQPFEKVENLSYEKIEKVMNVNFFGTVYLTKTCLPYLKKQHDAFIANVSSMGGIVPVPGQGIYGASKAAVKLLTESLYGELIDTSVSVTAVFPGATNTNITKNSQVAAPQAAGNQKNMPIMDPEDVALQILKAVQKKKLYVYTGKDSKTMQLMYRMRPIFAVKFIAGKMKALLS